jgi:hypothetical protein
MADKPTCCLLSPASVGLSAISAKNYHEKDTFDCDSCQAYVPLAAVSKSLPKSFLSISYTTARNRSRAGSPS